MLEVRRFVVVRPDIKVLGLKGLVNYFWCWRALEISEIQSFSLCIVLVSLSIFGRPVKAFFSPRTCTWSVKRFTLLIFFDSFLTYNVSKIFTTISNMNWPTYLKRRKNKNEFIKFLQYSFSLNGSFCIFIQKYNFHQVKSYGCAKIKNAVLRKFNIIFLKNIGWYTICDQRPKIY